MSKYLLLMQFLEIGVDTTTTPASRKQADSSSALCVRSHEEYITVGISVYDPEERFVPSASADHTFKP